MKTSMSPVVVIACLLYSSSFLVLRAQPRVSDVKASSPKVVLVELFTSEGCSDCPPADELLRRIDQKQTNSGQLIVGISEHVTYWNQLGWADPFSLSIYDQRQEAYSSRFGLDSVYTPQMVVNGSEQFVGSDSSRFSQALGREQQQPSPVSVRIVSTHVVDGVLHVMYSTSGTFPPQGVDLIAVVTDDLDHSDVRRGENSGRSLTHVAVARTLVRVAKLNAKTDGNAQLPIPQSYKTNQAHHLILLAQTSENGRVIGADSKAL